VRIGQRFRAAPHFGPKNQLYYLVFQGTTPQNEKKNQQGNQSSMLGRAYKIRHHGGNYNCNSRIVKSLRILLSIEINFAPRVHEIVERGKG
jgi:hypothetical protein